MLNEYSLTGDAGRHPSRKKRKLRLALACLLFISMQYGCIKRAPKIKDKELIRKEWLLAGDNGRAVLFIHGINGSPIHMLPFARLANQHGFTSRVILLPGHCHGHRELQHASAAAWQRKVEMEYDKLAAEYDDVTVVGFSLGSALTLQLCLNRPVARTVIISPPLKLWTENIFKPESIRKLGRVIMWIPVFKNYGTIELNGDTVRVPVNNTFWIHTAPLLEADKIVTDYRERLSEIDCDIQLIHARHDPVLDHSSSRSIFLAVSSKNRQLKFVDSRHHTMFLIDKQEEVLQCFEDFLLDGQQINR
ncbi:alpha/beta hydrolase [Planctomycetota bacterium]